MGYKHQDNEGQQVMQKLKEIDTARERSKIRRANGMVYHEPVHCSSGCRFGYWEKEKDG